MMEKFFMNHISSSAIGWNRRQKAEFGWGWVPDDWRFRRLWPGLIQVYSPWCGL